MTGYCPACDMGLGVNPMANVPQEWTDPQSVAKNVPVGITVPQVMMGKICGHTISVESFQKHNTLHWVERIVCCVQDYGYEVW